MTEDAVRVRIRNYIEGAVVTNVIGTFSYSDGSISQDPASGGLKAVNIQFQETGYVFGKNK